MEVRLHWLGWTRKDVTGDVLELGLLEGIRNHQADEEKEISREGKTHGSFRQYWIG